MDLTASGQCVADQGPAYQISAMIDRSPGEVFERGGYEEKVILHANDGRVRIKSGNNRIVVHDDSRPIYMVNLPTKNGIQEVSARGKLVFIVVSCSTV